MRTLIFLCITITITCSIQHKVYAQDSTKAVMRKNNLNVYMDCSFCDIEYIKENLNYINLVRDRLEADVHIMGTRMRAGNGGDQYTFYFIGQRKFVNVKDTLSLSFEPDVTDDIKRSERVRSIKAGLMNYIVLTDMIKDFDFEYLREKDVAKEIVEDKWKSWVFELSSRGFFRGEESYEEIDLSNSISINRITPTWKIESLYRYSYELEKYLIDEEEIESINTDQSFRHRIVRSLGNHWSLGYESKIGESSYENFDLYAELMPAIEYNVFRYEDANMKQFRILYSIGPSYFDYVDSTLYGQTKDLLFNHELKISMEIKKEWGSISSFVMWKNYLHDFNFNVALIDASVEWRIMKGLSIELGGSFGFIHDQLNIPAEEASSEEILLKQRQIQTEFEYFFEAGISYTFGSIYNNVVNPRFGRFRRRHH